MTWLYSVLTSSLFFLSVYSITNANHTSLKVQLNVSVLFDEFSGQNQVTLACLYHNVDSNKTIASDIRREISEMSFSLNESILSSKGNHSLLDYREWDFERGAMAQFILEKSKPFIGGFSCNTRTGRSSITQLIYMPESSEKFTTTLIVCAILAAVCVVLILLVMILAFFVVHYRKFRPSSVHKLKQVKDLPRQAHSKSSLTTYCPTLIQPLSYSTNLKTGQQEPSCSSSLPLHLQVKELKQISYIDSPDEITFDYNGGNYKSADHEVRLHVPRYAVPVGRRVTVRVGVSLTSHLQVPSGLRPVSPIVHFSVVDDPYFQFAQPVKIVLPHFLNVTSEKSGLHFLKAAHNQKHFKMSDGKGHFEIGASHGTLLTDHFCHYCIASRIAETQIKANFRLIKIVPRNQSSSWEAQFLITYFLRSCLRSVEKFYENKDCEVKSLRRFCFSEPLDRAFLEIHFERRLAGGWSLTQSGGSSKVSAHEVDFWGIGEDDLKQMEEEEIYPPRFVIGINGNGATDTVVASIKFSGAKDDLQTELSLNREPLGKSMSLSSSSPLVNPNKPTLPFLMNHIAVATPRKWRAIGLQLHLSFGQLEQIEEDCPSVLKRFESMFSLWENQPTGAEPYEWRSLFNALRSPQVSENSLAAKIEQLISIAASNASLTSIQSCPPVMASALGQE